MESIISVSVIMVTYKHEPFIREAIEGVLIQKTNFDVELIIADDCSPDNTGEVVNAIINENKKAKEIIRYTRHEKNKGMMPNVSWAIQQATGKYMAFCEGDDYWTDPNKLQMQVEFLENNPDYSGTCHNVLIKQTNAQQGLFHSESADCDFNIPELLSKGILAKINTASMVFRTANLLNEMDEQFSQLAFGDLPISLLLAKHGPIRYFSEVMAVYRKHDNGFTAFFNWETYARDYDFFYTYINRKLNYKYNEKIMFILKNIYIDSVSVNLGRNNIKTAHKSMLRLKEILNFKDYLTLKVIIVHLKYYFPFILKLKHL